MSTFTKLVLVCLIMWVIWKVVPLFVGKRNTYKGYKKRVAASDFLNRKRQSIALLEEVIVNAQELGLDETEVAIIHSQLAERYVRLKAYEQAAKHYDATFQVIQRDGQPWRYTPRFLTALQVLLHVGQRERAREIYADLLKRQSYDKRYQQIKKAEPWLEGTELPRVKL